MPLIHAWDKLADPFCLPEEIKKAEAYREGDHIVFECRLSSDGQFIGLCFDKHSDIWRKGGDGGWWFHQRNETKLVDVRPPAPVVAPFNRPLGKAEKEVMTEALVSLKSHYQAMRKLGHIKGYMKQIMLSKIKVLDELIDSVENGPAPTPDEIQQRKQEIHKNWTAEEIIDHAG